MSDKVFPLRSPCALLMAEFIRVITRAKLVEWGLADDDDPEAGFGANLDVGSDLAIGVNREEKGFTAAILFESDAEPMLQRTAHGAADLHEPEKINAAIDEALYLEVEDAYRAKAQP